eukprot:Lithocolla_globosa_v1_NODE_974_length_3001_cov_245.781059.p2 type:complete len:240 gc:universal NODE_974_length_3001_cov_245.781059:2194-1475(-)
MSFRTLQLERDRVLAEEGENRHPSLDTALLLCNRLHIYSIYRNTTQDTTGFAQENGDDGFYTTSEDFDKSADPSVDNEDSILGHRYPDIVDLLEEVSFEIAYDSIADWVQYTLDTQYTISEPEYVPERWFETAKRHFVNPIDLTVATTLYGSPDSKKIKNKTISIAKKNAIVKFFKTDLNAIEAQTAARFQNITNQTGMYTSLFPRDGPSSGIFLSYIGISKWFRQIPQLSKSYHGTNK